VDPAIVMGATRMGEALKRDTGELCRADEVAKRLGMSVDEVLGLISRGELPAVTFIDDDPFVQREQWFVHADDVDRMVRRTGRQDARPHERGWRGAEFLQLAGRLRNAIF
jgi:hypothetical protein